jgi:hypothetical protein
MPHWLRQRWRWRRLQVPCRWLSLRRETSRGCLGLAVPRTRVITGALRVPPFSPPPGHLQPLPYVPTPLASYPPCGSTAHRPGQDPPRRMYPSITATLAPSVASSSVPRGSAVGAVLPLVRLVVGWRRSRLLTRGGGRCGRAFDSSDSGWRTPHRLPLAARCCQRASGRSPEACDSSYVLVSGALVTVSAPFASMLWMT